MSVHFLSTALSKWDRVDIDALVVSIFTDERPLRGAAGLADWRLCGQLSRLLKKRRVTGARGESILMPPGRRLRFNRLFVFGLGDSKEFGEEVYRAQVRETLDVLRSADATRFAIQPPGRATGQIAARRALELWMEETANNGDDQQWEVHIVDTPGAQKEMADIFHAYKRRAAMEPGAAPR